MKDGKLLVLLLEDRDMWAGVAMEEFADKVEVIRALNCAEANELFNKYGINVDGMYVDALIQGEGAVDDEYTYDFVKLVRSRGYQGPMVTASSEGFMNDTLADAGCDIHSDKLAAPQDLLIALGL